MQETPVWLLGQDIHWRKERLCTPVFLGFLCGSSGSSAMWEFSSVQSLSHVWLFATPRTATRQASLSIINSWSLLKCPLSLLCHLTISFSVVPFSSCPQSFSASGSFQMISSLYQVANVLEFQLQHQSFWWTSGLIAYRMDWLDLLAVKGGLKSIFKHESSKTSILQHSAFLIVQILHP